MEITITISQDEQELLQVMLPTYEDRPESSEFTKRCCRSLLVKINEQYEQDIR